MNLPPSTHRPLRIESLALAALSRVEIQDLSRLATSARNAPFYAPDSPLAGCGVRLAAVVLRQPPALALCASPAPAPSSRRAPNPPPAVRCPNVWRRLTVFSPPMIPLCATSTGNSARCCGRVPAMFPYVLHLHRGDEFIC